MVQDNKVFTFTLTLLLAFILQVVFIAADRHETPGRVAVKYAKAFYKLDPAMGNYLSKQSSPDGPTAVVQDHIRFASDDAALRGFPQSMMKSQLYKIETHTTQTSPDAAQVKLSGKTRISVCPFFAWVAQIFQIGEVYRVEATIETVKEDGKWKVAGNNLAIPQV